MCWPRLDLKPPPVTAGAALVWQHLGAALPGQHSSHLQADKHLSSDGTSKQAAHLTAHHLAGCSPEGRLYAVNMAFTNQSTASTDAASVTVMASWSEAVTNFTQQNLQVTGCGGSNISYFGQVGSECWGRPGNPRVNAQLCTQPTRCVLTAPPALGDCAGSSCMSHMLHLMGPCIQSCLWGSMTLVLAA